MAKPYKELRDKMSPEAQIRSQQITFFHLIYDVLIEAGATASESYRESFIQAFTREDPKDPPPREWRFGGFLGFGGKFRYNSNGMYIDCYQEDENDRIREIISVANKQIANLVEPVVEKHIIEKRWYGDGISR